MIKISLNTPGKSISGDSYNIESVAGMPSGGEGTLRNIIQNSITILLIGTIIIALVFLIWGGIEWVTSGGSKDKIQAAQKKITFAAVGLAIALGAFMIVNIVGELFGITFFGV